MKDTVKKNIEYVAYLSKENDKGFLNLAYSQGEIILFLEQNIERAMKFRNKEDIILQICEDAEREYIEHHIKFYSITTTTTINVVEE